MGALTRAGELARRELAERCSAGRVGASFDFAQDRHPPLRESWWSFNSEQQIRFCQ